MRVGVRAINPLPRYWFRDTDSGLQESLLLFNRLLMLKWIWNEMQLEYGLRSAITFEISGWSWRFIYLAGYLAGCLAPRQGDFRGHGSEGKPQPKFTPKIPGWRGETRQIRSSDYFLDLNLNIKLFRLWLEIREILKSFLDLPKNIYYFY